MSIGGRSVARLVPRLAEAATGALVLAVFAIGFLPADLLAAVPRNSIDDDSRPAFELSGWLHYVQLVPEQQPTVTPSAPTVVPDAVVAPVLREKPAAQPPTPAAEKTNAPAEQAQPKPQAEKPVEQAQEQKAQDNPQEKPAEPAAATNAPKPDATPSSGPNAVPSSGGVVGAVQDWFARANREFQNVIIKDLSVPSPGTTKAEDEIAKKLKDTKEEEAKKAEDARRQQQADEQAKRDEEKKKLADKAAEADRKKAEEDAKKAAALAKKKADEDAKKAAEAAKPAPDVAQPAPQPAADADAAAKEKARIAEELRKTEQAQQDEARKKIEAQKAEAENASRVEKERLEAQRQAEEAKRLAEERRKADAIVAEEKRKRDAAAAAEQRRLTEDLRKAEEAQKQAEKSVERVQPAPVQQAEPKTAQRKVVITPEPVQRPELQGETYRPELKGKKPARSTVVQSEPDPKATLPRANPRVAVDDNDGGVSLGTVSTKVRKRRIKLYRVAEARVPYRGTAVKRWVYRAPMGLGGCRAAGRVSTPPSRYTVANGDSLWRISDSHYHSGARWNRIYRANRDRISDPDLIYPCQRFTVPGRH